jgi:uncharacterized tellurite resistance protein B-like protein
MIDLVKKFFGKITPDDRDAKEKASSHDIRVAACALFLEMANIDGEFSHQEKENIISILKRDFDLSGEHALALLEAAEEELERSIDLWKFAKLINENYSREEKTRIIEMVWRVVYTDGRLDKHEDYLAHKLAKILRLSHKELIDAKMKVIHPS